MTAFKVLMVSHVFPPKFGGAAIQSIYLSRVLQNVGVEVTYFTDHDTNKSQWTSFEGISVYKARTFFEAPSPIKLFIYAVRLLWFVAKNPQFPILHFHSIQGFESLLFPLFKRMGRKIILKLTLVGSDDPVTLKKRKIGFLYFAGLLYVDKFVAISSKLEELTLESGIPRQRIVKIPNGIDTDKFKKIDESERKELRSRLGLDRHQYIYLAIGKIEERKGYRFLLESWKTVQSGLSSAVLVVIGPGAEKSNPFFRSLQAYIQAQHFTNVLFLGEIRGSVDQYMKITDCFLHCSSREGLANVIIEAMSSSVPVVVKHIPGVTEDIILNPKRNVCFSDSTEEFGWMAIESLSADRIRAAQEEAEMIRKRFDIHTIAKEYTNLYTDILGV